VLSAKKKNFQIFQRLLNWVFENPRMIFSLSLLILGFLSWSLKWSRLEIDIYDVLDRSFQSSVDLFELKDSYGDNSQMLLNFDFKKSASAGELCALLNWAQKLSLQKDISSITSLWSLRSPRISEGKLWYPRTLGDPCLINHESKYKLSKKLRHSFFNHLISKKGDKNLVFDISFSGNESNSSNVQLVIDETQRFLRTSKIAATAHFLGQSATRYYFQKIIVQDSLFTLLIIVIILGLFRFLFGTWLSGILLALTIVLSSVILYGTMALAGIPINILTNNLFLMTAVAGTADFMFVSSYQLNGNYQESFRKLITPCFFTTLTTAVGFFSLNISDLNIIRQFGNGATLGAITEWLMVFVFIPSLLRVLRKDEVWVNKSKAINLVKLRALQDFTLPKPSYYLMILLMCGSVPSFFFLNDQDSPVHNLPLSHEMRMSYESFKKAFSWEGQIHLYFPEKISSKELQVILKLLSQSGLVYKAENPFQLADEWTKGMPSLEQALIRRELELSSLWKRYFSPHGQLRIPLYLVNQDLHSLRMLREKVSEACRGICRLSGQRVVYLEYGEKISRTMIESFAVSIFLVISILLYLLMKEDMLNHWKAVILSSLIGPLVTLSLISIFQIPMTLVTCIFLAVMVGLAGDNAIQFILADSSDLQKGIEDKAFASFLITFVMVAGSFLFLVQTLLPMRILGILFILGFIINLVGDYWGLKSLLARRT
jgi:predicted RND superfamily exporter protein